MLLSIESSEYIIAWDITSHCARFYCGRRGSLMVSALDSGSSGRFQALTEVLGKTLDSRSASLYPGV